MDCCFKSNDDPNPNPISKKGQLFQKQKKLQILIFFTSYNVWGKFHLLKANRALVRTLPLMFIGVWSYPWVCRHPNGATCTWRPLFTLWILHVLDCFHSEIQQCGEEELEFHAILERPYSRRRLVPLKCKVTLRASQNNWELSIVLFILIVSGFNGFYLYWNTSWELLVIDYPT